jgi:Raf kinase inhibitor-like YbhB/YbcL family protein
MVLAAGLAGCAPAKEEEGVAAKKEGGALQISSSAFEAGVTIPRQYTADGEDLSPPLAWQGAPAGTASFVVLCDDPDAPRGTWVHWVLYDLDPGVTTLAAGVPTTPGVAGGGSQGKNDFGKIGYGGPSPPPGPAHRYFFRVLALDRKLGLAPGVTMREVLAAVGGHVLARGELMGRYGR